MAGFDQRSVDRIARTVQRIERASHNGALRKRVRWVPNSAPNTVPALNISGLLIPAKSCVRWTPSSDGTVEISRPTTQLNGTNAQASRYGVTTAEIGIGSTGAIYANGLCTVRHTNPVGTTGVSVFLGPRANQFSADFFGPPFFRYVADKSSPGVFESLVVIEPAKVIVGKLSSSLAQNAIGSMVVWLNRSVSSGAALVATSDTINVKCISPDGLSSGLFISAIETSGVWWGMPLQCPP